MLFFVLFCFVSSIFVHVFDKLITWSAAINSNLTFPASHMLTCCILTLLKGTKQRGAVQHARTFHGKWNCSFLSFSPCRPIIKLWWLTADSCQSLNQEKVCVVCFLLQWWKKKCYLVAPMHLSYITWRINVDSISFCAVAHKSHTAFCTCKCSQVQAGCFSILATHSRIQALSFVFFFFLF